MAKTAKRPRRTGRQNPSPPQRQTFAYATLADRNTADEIKIFTKPQVIVLEETEFVVRDWDDDHEIGRGVAAQNLTPSDRITVVRSSGLFNTFDILVVPAGMRTVRGAAGELLAEAQLSVTAD